MYEPQTYEPAVVEPAVEEPAVEEPAVKEVAEVAGKKFLPFLSPPHPPCLVGKECDRRGERELFC